MAGIDKSLYFLEPRFERRVVLLSCTSARFWTRIGHEIDPECLNIDECKLVMRAARLIHAETKKPPEGTVIVLQRLRRQMDDGKVKYDDILLCGDMLLAAEDEPVAFSEDAAVAALVPQLKKRIAHRVVMTAMQEAQHQDDDEEKPFAEAAKLIEKAATLGTERVMDVGSIFGVDSYDLMEAAKNVTRLSTGVYDLDRILDGGPRRGGFGLWLAGTGGGKSVVLAHRVAHAAKLGMVCALATLELTREVQFARLKANLTGIPINDILDTPRCVEPRLATMKLGAIYLKAFTSHATSVADLRAWVDLVELKEGERRGVERVPVDFLAVDYADLLAGPKTGGDDNDHGYTLGKHVYGDLRIYAEGENSKGDGGHPGGPIWVDTASAATRSKDKRKHLTTDDVSDSLHKVRRATLVVSINRQEDAEMVEFHIAKNSFGIGGANVGPLPADFACARIAPIIEV